MINRLIERHNIKETDKNVPCQENRTTEKHRQEKRAGLWAEWIGSVCLAFTDWSSAGERPEQAEPTLTCPSVCSKCALQRS